MKTVVTMALSAIDRGNSGEQIHREEVNFIFGDVGSMYLGGRSFTDYDDHKKIGFYLRNSTMNTRIYPNNLTQKTLDIREIVLLRLKLKQYAYMLVTEHVETNHFDTHEQAQAFIDARDRSLIGPLWSGQY